MDGTASTPATAAATVRALWPRRPRNRRRDTPVATASANRSIFSNMMDLLYLGTGKILFRHALLCRGLFVIAMPVLQRLAGAGQDEADVLAVVDDALGDDDALLVDQKGEGRRIHLIALADAELLLHQD